MAGLDAGNCIPPLTAYFVMKIGRLPLIPYYRPGDQALGGAIRGLAGKHSAVLLANHGPVVSGSTLEAAVYATEELEETAKLFLLLRNTPTSAAERRADRRAEGGVQARHLTSTQDTPCPNSPPTCR